MDTAKESIVLLRKCTNYGASNGIDDVEPKHMVTYRIYDMGRGLGRVATF